MNGLATISAILTVTGAAFITFKLLKALLALLPGRMRRILRAWCYSPLSSPVWFPPAFILGAAALSLALIIWPLPADALELGDPALAGAVLSVLPLALIIFAISLVGRDQIGVLVGQLYSGIGNVDELGFRGVSRAAPFARLVLCLSKWMLIFTACASNAQFFLRYAAEIYRMYFQLFSNATALEITMGVIASISLAIATVVIRLHIKHKKAGYQ